MDGVLVRVGSRLLRMGWEEVLSLLVPDSHVVLVCSGQIPSLEVPSQQSRATLIKSQQNN